ncbi:CBS domain-containing protein [Fictibacillus norfolkensis]|uniref:CBS domain-containing protein n=1 Tax=Fictibacillus norfolkensis TaxID=2762233 RepID=A0ABR8SN57_9BACL|nr:CBS domain-containing protein [Fictibacillus norfolkensis]MBD7964925.1 CBS domain-containing protein [Fictibacillus norfolkensis]
MTNKEIELTHNLAERFEVAFNQIHGVLKRMNPHEYNDAFMKLLTETSQKHRYIQNFFYELRQFAKLRNALVHEKLKVRTYIATPSEEAVTLIEKIASLLTRPPAVTNIASKSVATIDLTTPIEEVIQLMHESSYNQLPVYENGVFVFLLTEDGLTSWLASSIRNGTIDLNGHTASEIQDYEKEHNVAFLGRNINIFELEDMYEDAFQSHRKLEAVIITETGSPLEKPLGIITTWDLIEIDLISEK